MNFSLSGLITDYHSLKSRESDLVLATIIETQGSTYRKAGARMLISRDMNLYGLLGGQSLHQAVISAACEVFNTRQAMLVNFEPVPGNEFSLEQELEPGASVVVLLEYLSCNDNINSMALIGNGLETGKDTVLVSVCESGIEEFPVGTSILYDSGNIIAEGLTDNINEVIRDVAEQVLQSGQSLLESCIVAEGPFSVFLDIVSRPLHLLIIGAGPDAVPVIRMAGEMGWVVTVVDPRESYISAGYLQQAQRLLNVDAEELTDELDIEKIDAVIIMTHRLDLDERFLKCFKGNSRIRYVGLLGTEKRREKLLEALTMDPEISGEHIYGPVGLDTGGKSPEQVALSLIAEIQAVINHRPGGHLTTKLPVKKNEPLMGEKDLYAIVLAAGGSRRFGGIKQLLEFNGKSLLKRVVDIASRILEYRVKLVLGIKHNKLQREVTGYDLEVINNMDWENGIASSLRAGINALPERCEATLILLCDQPLINESHLQQLIDAWKQNSGKIIASSFADTLGVPAIFPRKYFASILELKGDNGAKVIIENYFDEVVSVSIPEAEVDIDTQDDVIRILNRQV